MSHNNMGLKSLGNTPAYKNTISTTYQILSNQFSLHPIILMIVFVGKLNLAERGERE